MISSLAINFGLRCDKSFELVPLIQVHRRIVGKISFSICFRFPFIMDLLDVITSVICDFV